MFRSGLILLIALAGAANAQGIGNDARHNTTTYHSTILAKPDTPPAMPVAVQSDITRIAGTLETISQKQPSAEETDQAKRNLAAQEKIARWAPYVFWVAFAEFVITGFGVFLVWKTLGVAQEEVTEMTLPPPTNPV